MPLKLRIKPEGKLFINGVAVAKNVGNRPADLLILTDDQVSRTAEHADKVAKSLGMSGLQDALDAQPCGRETPSGE